MTQIDPSCHFIIIGGFLGAGKTTSVLQLARWIRDSEKKKVAVITNDQANGLVDTAITCDAGIRTAEIAGGCFCCRSDALVEAADDLLDASGAEVIIAEPVGSCTDLSATVLGPLLKVYGKDYRILPLSVVVDPFRASRFLKSDYGGEVGAGSDFSEEVCYIYGKQLEEAEIIVINKADLLSRVRLNALKEGLSARFPQAEVISVSARTGAGLEEWWRLIFSLESKPRPLADLDYTLYAQGEAKLGWFNARYVVSSPGASFDPDEVLSKFGGEIASGLRAQNLEVAHLKATVTQFPRSVSPGAALGLIQWTRNDGEVETVRRIGVWQNEAEVTVNLRAEADPTMLEGVVAQVIASNFSSLSVRTETVQSFSPAAPKPLFREDRPW